MYKLFGNICSGNGEVPRKHLLFPKGGSYKGKPGTVISGSAHSSVDDQAKG